MVWRRNAGEVFGQGAPDEAIAILYVSSIAGAEYPQIQASLDGFAKLQANLPITALVRQLATRRRRS
jgi:hypothetical protein